MLQNHYFFYPMNTEELKNKYPGYYELIMSNIRGDESSEKAEKILLRLESVIEDNGSIERSDVVNAISEEINSRTVQASAYKFPKTSVRPRSEGQAKYIKALERSDIVVGIGPAGTGKTFLAVAKAVNELLKRNVKKIILTRPAVEAGESLGFLPGDMKEKVDPYLRPLYDSLYAMLERDRVERYIKDEIIEIAPLAFMRGRTLANSYLILDEAQNTTSLQMKMFLTRLGVNSKAVITGDITQIDLQTGRRSGLIEMKDIVNNIEAIEFVTLTSKDVVRHPLVKDIIDAYSEFFG